jgi:hypothetical protein
MHNGQRKCVQVCISSIAVLAVDGLTRRQSPSMEASLLRSVKLTKTLECENRDMGIRTFDGVPNAKPGAHAGPRERCQEPAPALPRQG